MHGLTGQLRVVEIFLNSPSVTVTALGEPDHNLALLPVLYRYTLPVDKVDVIFRPFLPIEPGLGLLSWVGGHGKSGLCLAEPFHQLDAGKPQPPS